MAYDANWYNTVGRNQVIDWNNFKFDENSARNVPSSSSSDSASAYYKEYLKMIKEQNATANALSIQEAQKNRDWQTEMSNTAHQREVADLKAAGLNPVLSANSGASAGSGATASISDSSGAVGSIASAAIAALASIANTQANNAKDVAINQKNLDLQEALGYANLDLNKMLGLAGLDLQKYGIDVGHQNAQIAASASNYAANISKLNTEMSNDAAWNRLVEQGHIDLNKITSQRDADILKQFFSGSGIHGEKDYINMAMIGSYLLTQGLIDSETYKQVIADKQGHGSTPTGSGSSGRYSHHK